MFVGFFLQLQSNCVGPGKCYVVFSTREPERPQWKQIFSVLKRELL